MGDMPRPRPPYLHREETRHGTIVWYVRRAKAPRTRLREPYGTPEFWAEYRAAIEGTPFNRTADKPKAHTLAWAIERYRNSPAWASLAPATRKQRGNILRVIAERAGSDPLSHTTEEAIRQARDRRAATPHSANNFLKAMRGLFGWALEEKLVTVNPTKGVKLLPGPNDKHGFHAWSEEEAARFEARWPMGTRERLAYDLLLYTGLRRGDAAKLGRQHIRDGLICVRTEKTGDDVVIPLYPELEASIAASATGDLTFIVTERGTPFVKESFGNWFGEVCRAAGCPGSAHGLRKLAATRLAERGASEKLLMALFGWSTGKMATHYTQSADKKRFAREAARLMLPARSENEERPHLGSGAGVRVKRQANSGA